MTSFRKLERNLKSHREPKSVRNSSKSVTFRKKNQNTPITLLFWKVTLFQTGCHLLSPKVTNFKMSFIIAVTKVTPKVTLFLKGTIFLLICSTCGSVDGNFLYLNDNRLPYYLEAKLWALTSFWKFEHNFKSHREPKSERNSWKSVTVHKKKQNTPIIPLFWKVTLFQTGCHLLSPKVTKSKLSNIIAVTKVTPKVTLFFKTVLFFNLIV